MIQFRLVLNDIVAQACGDRSAVTFCLRVRLCVVSRGSFLSDTKNMVDCLLKLRYKLRAVVGQNRVWYAVWKDVVDHSHGWILPGGLLRHRDYPC